MRRLWKTVLVCACVALALVGVAAPRATDQTWEWTDGPSSVTIVRPAAGEPITGIQVSGDATCQTPPGGIGAYTINIGQYAQGPIAVAGDGSFAFDGPSAAEPMSRLRIRGRFANGHAMGTFSVDGILSIGPCVIPETAFDATCSDCDVEPPPPPKAPFAPTASDRTLVPFRQISRATLGATVSAVRAKYLAKNYLGKNSVHGRTLSFFAFFDADGEIVGPHLQVYSNVRGRVWLVAAYADDVSDRSSWVRTAGGVGIGSTFAEVRRAFPSLSCRNRLGEDTCGVDQGTKRSRRSTDFAFDRPPKAAGARVMAVRVAAWGIEYG